jgi:putative oxidoreductase
MEDVMKNPHVEVIPPKPTKALGIALWTAQITLAMLFLFAGVMKFVMPVKEMTSGSSLPGSFFHFIGVMEVLGAIGLVLPCLLRISPFLTPVAACGLVIIMAGATVTSIPMGWISLLPLFVGVAAAFIAYGRFKLLPIQPRL